jgi:hypothetical protein
MIQIRSDGTGPNGHQPLNGAAEPHWAGFSENANAILEPSRTDSRFGDPSLVQPTGQ